MPPRDEPRIWLLRADCAMETDVGNHIGPPRLLGAMQGLYEIPSCSWDSTGWFKNIDAENQTQAVVLDVAKSAEVARLGPHRGLNQSATTLDGLGVATATWKGKDVKVWGVATGRLAWQLPCDSAFVRFSPDGRWLAWPSSRGTGRPPRVRRVLATRPRDPGQP